MTYLLHDCARSRESKLLDEFESYEVRTGMFQVPYVGAELF